MKIAISNIAWEREEDEVVAQLLQQYGVTGLDVAPGKLADNPLALGEADIRRYVDFWRDYGVQIVGMQSMLYGRSDLKIFEDAEIRQHTKDYMKSIIRLAANLGVKPMVFGSPKNRQIGDMNYDSALDIASEFFSELAQYAYEHDTILCLEPNPVDYGADFINTTAEALELVKRVNQPGFQLHLDAAIMSMNGEDIAESLDSAIGRMAHFHISEPQLGVISTDSEVRHEQFAGHLHRLNYDNWVSIEMRGGWTNPNSQSVESALSVVTSIYRDSDTDES